jgi:hypothetical protein
MTDQDQSCIECGTALLELDKDPDRRQNATCARCRAEQAHDFDAEPNAVFSRAGVRTDVQQDAKPEVADRRIERLRLPSEQKRFVIKDRGEASSSMLVMHSGYLADLVEELQAQGESKAAQVVSEIWAKGRAYMDEPESYIVDYQCLHCKKYKGRHQDGFCPIPSTSRTFLHYSKTDKYEPNLKKPHKVPFVI